MKAHARLEAWQEARKVCKTVLQISKTEWGPHIGAVFGQLQRSSLSVQLNIAEGYSYGPGKRCRNFLRIAYGSAVETEDLLDLLSDEIGPSAQIKAKEALVSCTRCQRLLLGLIRHYST